MLSVSNSSRLVECLVLWEQSIRTRRMVSSSQGRLVATCPEVHSKGQTTTTGSKVLNQEPSFLSAMSVWNSFNEWILANIYSSCLSEFAGKISKTFSASAEPSCEVTSPLLWTGNGLRWFTYGIS